MKPQPVLESARQMKQEKRKKTSSATNPDAMVYWANDFGLFLYSF